MAQQELALHRQRQECSDDEYVEELVEAREQLDVETNEAELWSEQSADAQGRYTAEASELHEANEYVEEFAAQANDYIEQLAGVVTRLEASLNSIRRG